jgi:hypothetical protein
MDEPANANIQIVNLKSVEKPFEVVWTNGNHFRPFSRLQGYSTFGWWNHWPVAQIPSSGRMAVADDRPSHSSLSHIFWAPSQISDRTETKLLMCGLTSQSPAHLIPLAKSWLSPPQIKALGEGVLGVDYDPSQRAYIVRRRSGTQPSKVVLSVSATDQSPLVNPAFIVENWAVGAIVQVAGRPGKSAGAARSGLSRSIERDDLVVWIPLDSTDKTEISIAPRP